ncbi:hypothetical protein KAR91_55705 [Candidatus Pacearchaeota archaeon]|nr:hypothetical protein [Candidatus Pacearchaeota archaeon]
MKSPKTGKDNEIVNFYPEKKVITLQDMTTELAYKLDAIPTDRDSYFTTKYLNKLQKGEVDNSAKWSVADRIFDILQYGIQQNEDLKVKFNYNDPCQYCGKRHAFSYDYAKLADFKGSGMYKAPPKAWPVEKWGDQEIELKPTTGEFETLIEFQEGQYWDKKLNGHKKGTIEHENFISELEEHNSTVFFEVQLLKVSAHTGVETKTLKELDVDKFAELLKIVQKNVKTLNYGIQFWKDEGDQLSNPGLIEHYHTCPEPDEEHMKANPELLKKYKEGGPEAILFALPFRSEHCT